MCVKERTIRLCVEDRNIIYVCYEWNICVLKKGLYACVLKMEICVLTIVIFFPSLRCPSSRLRIVAIRKVRVAAF